MIGTHGDSTVELILLNTDGTLNAYQDLGAHFDGSAGVHYSNVWFEMLPGGIYEGLVFQFSTGANGYALISELHIASGVPIAVSTEITPEPAAFALLGSGIVGLAAWRRRRSK